MASHSESDLEYDFMRTDAENQQPNVVFNRRNSKKSSCVSITLFYHYNEIYKTINIKIEYSRISHNQSEYDYDESSVLTLLVI